MTTKNPLGDATIAEIKQRTDMMERIWAHYANAREKHPYFCDGLLPRGIEPPELPVDEQIAINLMRSRNRLKRGAELGNILWNEVLDSEVWEATEAMSNREYDKAVEELFDCIAVLLRTIDVLEGRQKLGKPETKGEAK